MSIQNSFISKRSGRKGGREGEDSEYEPLTAPLSYAEIYYEMIKSKIPSLFFLGDLIHDISEVAVPLQVQQATPESLDWNAREEGGAAGLLL